MEENYANIDNRDIKINYSLLLTIKRKFKDKSYLNLKMCCSFVKKKTNKNKIASPKLNQWQYMILTLLWSQRKCLTIRKNPDMHTSQLRTPIILILIKYIG